MSVDGGICQCGASRHLFLYSASRCLHQSNSCLHPNPTFPRFASFLARDPTALLSGPLVLSGGFGSSVGALGGGADGGTPPQSPAAPALWFPACQRAAPRGVRTMVRAPGAAVAVCLARPVAQGVANCPPRRARRRRVTVTYCCAPP